MKHIAIIGGGASGLMAALFAARTGADVTIYEHNNNVGKKILASGNGRCNIINTTASYEDYAGADPQFVTYALKQLNFYYFEKFCHSIGLVLDIKEDGRCYPLSNEAKSVLIALKSAVSETGVKIITDSKVIAITKHDSRFNVQTEMDKHNYNNVLIATGSEAAPQLGATGDGYTFARAFGHEILPTYPSLVQLHLNSKNHPKMAGVKTVAEVTLFIDNKSYIKVTGDILFAAYGISGLAILDISQRASYALLHKQRVSISLNLLPRYEREELVCVIEKLFASIPKHDAHTALCGLLPAKIVTYLLEDAAITQNTPVSSLNQKDVKKLAHLIGEWEFEVTDTHGFKHAEVSGGGVSTAQINNKTMESKLIEGLYFAGEVIDIVGRRGGYNFNFAWASGMIAGKEMGK
ncbi:MAG: NAD(P)/FAD-dependent oxidoreductase [Sulfuricurvum sp.]|uniref:NAD(P)/FAD-dependent oxidoreductase n=1 Tax=Sulfuricurvum sp. TaxID=2025608 RepID=UPI002618F33F|nr:NAD(P)/FAD-dependent oxidoreductase [Sulfuricurvum sp.]MDD2828344.1 NAD(P)/FAD-dependent oxidoreductase [Sulfuricurvum sp.]MDD4949349.1 NAD(P)/FAD-dependent oxidoreductase [Sulfuricurvum sp.]